MTWELVLQICAIVIVTGLTVSVVGTTIIAERNKRR